MKLRLLFAGLVAINLVCVDISDAEFNAENIVALWSFDEGSGEIAYDSSGNENHGELMEGPTWVDGKFGKALKFDGEDDYVEVPHSNSLDITEALSITVWAKFTEYPGHEQLLLDKGPLDASPTQYFLSFEPAEKAYFLNFHGQSWHAGDNFNSPEMNDTEWHHVAVTFDTGADKIKSCLDGECNEYTTDDNLMSKGEHHLAIGTARFLQSIAGYYFNGVLDELAVFNVALTENDIQTIMLSSLAAVYPEGKLATTWAQLKRW